MSHNDDELQFSSFLPQEDDEPQQDAEVATDGEQTNDESDVEQSSGDSDDESQEQVAPSTEERVSFEDRLRARGFEVDGLDPNDLYDSAIERISAASRAMQEAAELREELEKLRAAQQTAAPATPTQPAPQPAPAPAEDESPKEFGERLFRELQQYDNSLLQYVTHDDNGRAIPRSEYGQTAIDAAQTINSYHAAERKQAEMLLHNPSLLIREHMSDIEKLAEQKAREIFKSQIDSWQQEQEKAKQEQEAAKAAADRQQRMLDFHERNKAKIFNLGPDGEPMRMPLDPNSFSHTPTGKYFMKRVPELSQELPGVDQLRIFEIAMREAELAAPPAQAKPAPAPRAEQKKQFAQQRQAVASVPNQDAEPAGIRELVDQAPVLQFADMVRRDPDNADVISHWK